MEDENRIIIPSGKAGKVGKVGNGRSLDLGKESILIEYDPTSRYEKIVIEIANNVLSQGSYVLLVSSRPRTDVYLDALRKHFENGALRLVNLSITGTLSLESEIIEIPVKQLEWFSDVFGRLTKDSIVIFEPLSDIILHIGMEQSYTFLRHNVELIQKGGAGVAVMINYNAHKKEDLSAFENLLLNLARISNDRLEMIR